MINKENYESIKNDTFENKTIASMVPEKLEWMIKNYNLTIKLANSKKIEMDPKYVEWSKKNINTVKFNPADRTVSGWQAGMLFPPETIKMDDPHAGDKVIWNLRAATYGATMDLRDIAWAFLDAKKGYERVQAFQSRRYYMEGRLDGGPITVPANAGANQASELEGSIGELRRDAHHALRDLKGIGRTIVDLI